MALPTSGIPSRKAIQDEIDAAVAAAPRPIGRAVASGGAGNTNASGFITVTIAPALPWTPAGFVVNVSNSGLSGSVDLANSSASSLRIYFRQITATGSPVWANQNPGPFAWLAFPA